MHDLECARSLTRLTLGPGETGRESHRSPADSAPLLHLLTNDGGS